MKMKNALLTAAITVGLGVSSIAVNAGQFEDFTIDETQLTSALLGSSIPPLNNVVADTIGGSYREIIDFDITGAFTTVAFADFAFYTDDGVALNPVTQTTIDLNYDLYATFDATGLATGTGGFVGTSANFSLFLDVLNDTSATVTTGTGVVISDGAEDLLLASSSMLIDGLGVVNPSGSSFFGAFGLLFDDLLLTANGKKFFVNPDPFYLITNITGDFDSFDSKVLDPQFIQGQLGVVFRVPEPGILGLMGIALLGFGLSRRKA